MQHQQNDHSTQILEKHRKKHHGTKKNHKLFKMNTLKSLSKNKWSAKQAKSKTNLSEKCQISKNLPSKLESLPLENKRQSQLPSKSCLIDLQSMDIVKYVQQQQKLKGQVNVCSNFGMNNNCQKFVTQLSEEIENSDDCLQQQSLSRYNSLESRRIKFNNLPALYNHLDRSSKTEPIQDFPFNFNKNQNKQKKSSNDFKRSFQTHIKINCLKSPKNFEFCQPKLYNDFIFENTEKKQDQGHSKQIKKNDRLFRLTMSPHQHTKLQNQNTYNGLYQSMYSTGFKQKFNHTKNNYFHIRKKLIFQNDKGSEEIEKNQGIQQKKEPQKVINYNKFDHISFQTERDENIGTNEDSGLKRFIKLLSNSKKTSRTMKAQINKNSLYHIKLRKNNYQLFIENSKQNISQNPYASSQPNRNIQAQKFS